ncbi:MAG: hypothetical protein EOM55_01140 [Clostridia bacterium]|nr:hypothetical protein [Clostridia bacterium]
MSKARSKTKLCIVAILTIIGLLLTFVSFVVPTTNTTFNSFIGAINFGYDIGGGRLSVYEVSEESLSDSNFELKLDETVRKFKDSFSGYGFDVTRQGDTVRIEVSHYDDSEMTALLSSGGSSYDLQTIIAGENGISFNSSSSEFDAEGSVTEEYIKSCSVGTSLVSDGKDVWPVTIEFSEDGQELFKELTQSIVDNSGSLYMYINGTVYNSSGFSLTQSQSSLTLYATSQASAKALQIQVNALAKPFELSTIVDDIVTSGLNTGTGVFFGNVKAMLSLSLLTLFVACVIYLILKYRMLGVLATVAMLIFIVIYAFLLQSIPLVLIDINGLMGVLFTFSILFFNIIGIFERIKKEYSLGKKITNSVNTAFRKSVLPTLERYIFLLLFCAVLYIVGSTALMAFSTALFVGLFVNYFVLFVALKGMSSSYLVINSTKKTYYNLKREEVKNEI